MKSEQVVCGSYHSIQSDGETDLAEDFPIISSSIRSMQGLKIFDKIFLAVLMLILFVGFTTGLYLLIREGHEWRTQEVYNLTSREFWRAREPSSRMPRLKLPVERVLFVQTNGSSCDSKSQCAHVVQELQSDHMSLRKEPDILYNFLVSGDGSVFEGRGWDFRTTDMYSTTDVTVAFVGKFDEKPPTPKQSESAKLFIDVAVTEGKLVQCFNILVWGENRFFIDMASKIQRERSGCRDIT